MEHAAAHHPPRFALIGFGALAEALTTALRNGGAPAPAVYTRPRSDPDAAAALSRRLAAAGVETVRSAAEAAAAADVVVAAVPATGAVDVAAACAPGLRPGALYIDPTPLPPEQKLVLSELIASAGAEYADVAVLGTVAVSGAAVPMLASGSGAGRWADAGGRYGLRVSVLDGPAGRASLVKLLRSVYMKGRDALILEMVVSARRHGVEDAVIASIGGPGEQVPFPDLVARVLRSLAVYADRRSAELDAAAELVADAALDPLLTEAGAARLRWMADLGVREAFGAERPETADAVLSAIDALDAAGRSLGAAGGAG
ncbi:MAG: hypothetical protein QOH72_5206 [Solirubrobacteraceae bacterium]|jgi:3-hydroxyisobutyrate dehydrogenase-like beta-hydroxyacid dehydrogenase|nr:hypothetical protein [Solirubrobacteraceae bacterium]